MAAMDLQQYTADLHVHSVLSPCGDLEMSPSRIIEKARADGLNLVAITDHNMVENGAALRAAAAGGPVSVLFGMELETVEEVHLICLFDELDAGLEWQRCVYALLPDVANDPDRFGDQVVVDEEENVVRFEPRLLANATQIPLDRACAEVLARGGLAVAAHVDRPAHSVLGQLGFLPPDLPLDAVELTRYATADFLAANAAWLRRLPQVRFSDAHFLHDLGSQRTLLRIAAPTVAEIRMALRGEAGRSTARFA